MTNKKGFTLIELLIVITIIGVLAVALLPRIAGIPAKGRDTARITAMNGLVQALQSYYSDNGKYPTAAACLKPGLSNPHADITKLKRYVDGDFPADPQSDNFIDNASTCKGGYYYKPLTLNNSPAQAYMLIANTESDGYTEQYYDLNSSLQITALDTQQGFRTAAVKASDPSHQPDQNQGSGDGNNNVYIIAR